MRGTCLVYAAVQLFVALPLYLVILPSGGPSPAARAGPNAAATSVLPIGRNIAIMVVLAATLTIAAVISSTLSVHLLTILQRSGTTLAAAVGLGALVGPSRVAARTIEARFHHPIWTKFASITFVAIGVSVLWAGMPIVPLALAFYRAGIGLESIARGTLPAARNVWL